jgi:hypothetical protein
MEGISHTAHHATRSSTVCKEALRCIEFIVYQLLQSPWFEFGSSSESVLNRTPATQVRQLEVADKASLGWTNFGDQIGGQESQPSSRGTSHTCTR